MKTRFWVAVSLLAAVLSITACTKQAGRQSESDAVKRALEQADLKEVTVSDDASKNTITLGGTLHSDEAKAKAADVAKSAASDRIIANEISVQPVGEESEAKSIASNLDDGIENNYKAALIAHHLDKQSIHYNAKNGVLTLSGSVKNASLKSQAGQLASKVPNVKQVVNQVEAHP
jgi:osmotically-inducible protein OsmY